jgi:hypothetical protein
MAARRSLDHLAAQGGKLPEFRDPRPSARQPSSVFAVDKDETELTTRFGN